MSRLVGGSSKQIETGTDFNLEKASMFIEKYIYGKI